jgi:hypothetical protein
MISSKIDSPTLEHAASAVLAATKGQIAPDQLYDSKQVSEILGVSRRTLERWRSDGVGIAVTRLWENAPPKYRGADILAALDRGREAKASGQSAK